MITTTFHKFLQLPIELQENIVSYISYEDISSFVRTSKASRHVYLHLPLSKKIQWMERREIAIRPLFKKIFYYNSIKNKICECV